MNREHALSLARQIVANWRSPTSPSAAASPWAPMSGSLRDPAKGGVEIKIETNGLDIGDAACDKLERLKYRLLQISIDGATAAVHRSCGRAQATRRPGRPSTGSSSGAWSLSSSSSRPSINVDDAAAVYEQAAPRGVRTFVTGPMMRLGRGGGGLGHAGCDGCSMESSCRGAQRPPKPPKRQPRLACYPWGIQQEMSRAPRSPQAMLLVVPNGKVKLLNALPFAVADPQG